MTEEKEEIEIDLLELAKKLWSKRKFILKVSLIALVVGVIIALSIPKVYKSSVILTTDSAKSSSGNMGALASLAGVNLGSNGGNDVLSPDLYPDVLGSTPFIQGLFDVKVEDSNQKVNGTLFEYFQNEQKTAWWNYILQVPGLLINLFSSDDEESSNSGEKNIRAISKKEMSIINSIKNTYEIDTEKKTGITTLEVSTQSPVISAFLADTLTTYLQSYIIEQRTKKAKTDLENSEKLHVKARNDYYKAQQNLASFVDANQSITSAKYKINQEKLQNEANIAYAVYNQMAQQVQMDKIKIQDNTPVFTIIQPAIEPLIPVKPRKKIIVLAFIFLGVVGSCGWILGKEYIKTLRKNSNI